MTELIFSFDTEDFTSNEAADAILREAEILREEGIRGCFCLVGLLAQQLMAWKRDDVISALSYHEIANHTYGHSVHPIINEYTDIADAKEAIERVKREEKKSLALIEKATGRKDIVAAVPPGNQKSYAAMYAFHEMGIPIFADSFADTDRGHGLFYCNVYNIDYTRSLESFLFNELSDEDMIKLLDSFGDRERVIMYHHPNMAIYPSFWDKLNYYKENLCEFGKWKYPERRPHEDTERFYKNFRRFARLVKSDSRFKITGYKEIAEKIKNEPLRKVLIGDVPHILESLKKSFSDIKAPVSLSLADCMLAARDLLLGKPMHVCGTVHGFLEAPYGVKSAVTVSSRELRESARLIEDGNFLPPKIPVGEKLLGPADWLFAALEVLSGKDSVKVLPKPQLPSLDVIPKTRDASFKGTWMHSDSFKDEYLSERLRLQSYTLRYLSES